LKGLYRIFFNEIFFLSDIGYQTLIYTTPRQKLTT
jgi:hypothetical protein